ncbi:hypothetical protein WJX77_005644 [Trebouxia sp. C0004]
MAHVRPNSSLPSAYQLRGETLSGMIIKEIEKWGGTRFAAIVTDNASNMQKTRRLVLKRCPHMIEVRCMMHAFSTTMASVMGHKTQSAPLQNHHNHDNCQDALSNCQRQGCETIEDS